MRKQNNVSLTDVDQKMLDKLAARVGEKAGSSVKAIWLYGSRARGEGAPESDLDVMVVVESDMEAWQEEFLELAHEVERQYGRFLHLKVLSYDLAWLQDRREIEAFFIQEVDRDKVVLFGSEL